MPGATFLDEFKQFLAFLQNLWGLLAGVAVFFPLSNVLVNVIPLQSLEHDGAFAKLSPALVTALATVTTLFVVLWTFGRRDEFTGGVRRRVVQRQAMFSFGAGLGCLLLYLVGYDVKLTDAYAVWGWESQDPRHLLAEVPLLIAYVAAFAFFTRAFLLLAMTEFFASTPTAR